MVRWLLTVSIILLFIFLFPFYVSAQDKNPAKTDDLQKDSNESKDSSTKAVAESMVDDKEGTVTTKNLPLNLEITYEEKTFDKKGTLSIYSMEKDLGVDSFERLSPIWAIKCDIKFRKKAKFVFQFDKELNKIGSEIVVLTWWANNWIITGIPQVNIEDGTTEIEADYSGWFTVVRTKSRDEIKMDKYTFPDGDKRGLAIVGCFSYETKYRKGEDLLEEKLQFVENFSGDITFGPIERKKRTGVAIFYAGAVGDPLIQYYKGKITIGEKKEAVFATETKIPKQRGVISGQLKDEKLRFDGMPTVITLWGLYNDKKVLLPTIRGDLNLSGIGFDWKLQEMFHLRNFVYKTKLTMPHSTGDEQTRLVVYLQFIVR
jgi:hypothetical protein